MAQTHLNYHDHIVVNPKIMGGKPVVKGTRIPVELVLERLTHDLEVAPLFEDYPNLTEADVKAILAFANATIRKEASPKQSRHSLDEVLALAGAWGERDWIEVERDLDRIRHESVPTPPIDFDF